MILEDIEKYVKQHAFHLVLLCTCNARLRVLLSPSFILAERLLPFASAVTTTIKSSFIRLECSFSQRGGMLSQFEQVGCVELATIQFSHRVNYSPLTNSAFAHGLDVFGHNGLLEREHFPVHDRIFHSCAVPSLELLPGV